MTEKHIACPSLLAARFGRDVKFVRGSLIGLAELGLALWEVRLVARLMAAAPECNLCSRAAHIWGIAGTWVTGKRSL